MTCFLHQPSQGCISATVIALLAIIWLPLLFSGCSSTAPAPVSGWDWKEPVPAGYDLVRRGDSLGLIAQRHGIDARKLAQWNDLKPPYTLYPETLLRIAPPNGSMPPKRVARTASATAKTGDAMTGKGRRRDAKTATPVDQSRVAEPAESRRDASGVVWDWPLSGTLLQTFRADDRARQGIRLGGRAGEQVRACADGQVVYSGDGLKSYGNLIIVKHNDTYLSAYGFNRRLLVTEGDRVKRGQPVAEIGQGAEGAYLLHFEIRREGTAVDPLHYLPPRN